MPGRFSWFHKENLSDGEVSFLAGAGGFNVQQSVKMRRFRFTWMVGFGLGEGVRFDVARVGIEWIDV